MWVYKNQSADALIDVAKGMLEKCGVDTCTVRVKFDQGGNYS